MCGPSILAVWFSGGCRSTRALIDRGLRTLSECDDPSAPRSSSHQIANRGLGSRRGTEESCAFDACDGAMRMIDSAVLHQARPFAAPGIAVLDVGDRKAFCRNALRELCQGTNFAVPAVATQDIDLSFAFTVFVRVDRGPAVWRRLPERLQPRCRA